MKKRILKMASIIIVLLMAITPISAHPGRTDANGGHYCRTNCAKWGLEMGNTIITMVEDQVVLHQVRVVNLHLNQVVHLQKHPVHLK